MGGAEATGSSAAATASTPSPTVAVRAQFFVNEPATASILKATNSPIDLHLDDPQFLSDLTWKCECKALSYQFGVIWRMWSLTFARTPLANDGQSIYSPRVGVLTLNLETNVFSGDASKTFEQEISRFQVTDYSVLELDLIEQGHVYGAIVLRLLGLCTSVQRLKRPDGCHGDCRCDHPDNWRSQSISLLDLKEVEIQRFRGADHEFDLLKALLRCATVLETVTLGFSRKVSSSDGGCMKIVGILKDYPSVKCSIYQYGKRIFTHE